MPLISIGDCSLYYERRGVGFPVLFVSGLAGFASFWQDQVPAFARRFEVITFDHRERNTRRLPVLHDPLNKFIESLKLCGTI